MKLTGIAHPNKNSDKFNGFGFRPSELKELSEKYVGRQIFSEHEHEQVAIGRIVACEVKNDILLVHFTIDDSPLGEIAKQGVREGRLQFLSVGFGYDVGQKEVVDLETGQTHVFDLGVTVIRPAEISLVANPGIPGSHLLMFGEMVNGEWKQYKNQNVLPINTDETMEQSAPSPVTLESLPAPLAAYFRANNVKTPEEIEKVLKNMTDQAAALEKAETDKRQAIEQRLQEEQRQAHEAEQKRVADFEAFLKSPEMIGQLAPYTSTPDGADAIAVASATALEHLEVEPLIRQLCVCSATHARSVVDLQKALESSETHRKELETKNKTMEEALKKTVLPEQRYNRNVQDFKNQYAGQAVQQVVQQIPLVANNWAPVATQPQQIAVASAPKDLPPPSNSMFGLENMLKRVKSVAPGEYGRMDPRRR